MKRGHLLPFHKVVRDIPPDKIHQVTADNSKGEIKKTEDPVLNGEGNVGSSGETAA